MINRLYIFLLLPLMLSCTNDDVSDYPVCRLDKVLADYASYSQSRQIEVLDSLRPELDAMFAVMGDDYISMHTLDAWSRSRVVEVFQPDVDKVYPDVTGLERQIGYMMDYADKDSLRLPHLRFATVTWGLPRKIVRVDTIVLIALNHYLGADYPGYDTMPEYLRADKSPEYLQYDLAAVVAATQYPFACSGTPTLLSWMLYEGALVEARMRFVKDADVAMALGLSPEQYRYAEDNCKAIWEEMAVRRLIYDTDEMTIDRYISAAPMTPLLGSTTPGRVGRYIGYKIVRAYIDSHPKAGLAFLLSPQFYCDRQSLIDSGFSPR